MAPFFLWDDLYIYVYLRNYSVGHFFPEWIYDVTNICKKKEHQFIRQEECLLTQHLVEQFHINSRWVVSVFLKKILEHLINDKKKWISHNWSSPSFLEKVNEITFLKYVYVRHVFLKLGPRSQFTSWPIKFFYFFIFFLIRIVLPWFRKQRTFGDCCLKMIWLM